MFLISTVLFNTLRHPLIIFLGLPLPVLYCTFFGVSRKGDAAVVRAP